MLPLERGTWRSRRPVNFPCERCDHAVRGPLLQKDVLAGQEAARPRLALRSADEARL